MTAINWRERRMGRLIDRRSKPRLVSKNTHSSDGRSRQWHVFFGSGVEGLKKLRRRFYDGMQRVVLQWWKAMNGWKADLRPLANRYNNEYCAAYHIRLVRVVVEVEFRNALRKVCKFQKGGESVESNSNERFVEHFFESNVFGRCLCALEDQCIRSDGYNTRVGQARKTGRKAFLEIA